MKYHAAVSYDHDKDTKFYLRSSIHNKIFGLGSTFKCCEEIDHAAEMQYNMDEKKAGLFGQ